jgi:hypothetical protein
LRHEQVITAYFNSAGHEVTTIPCPDFETFIADTSLMYPDVMFISDLPRYVIPAGTRILEANRYNEFPHREWLPAPPDLSSFHPSSRSGSYTSSQRSRSLLSRHDSFVRHRPDPNGIDPGTPVPHPYNRCAPSATLFMRDSQLVHGASH